MKFLKQKIVIFLNSFKNFLYIIKSCKNIKNYLYAIRNFKNLIESENLTFSTQVFVQGEKKYYEDKYFFKYDDWFSKRIPIWKHILSKFFKSNEKIKYLEIGTFEGRSCLFICENFQEAKLVTVDTFKGKDHPSGKEKQIINFNIVLENFKKNTCEYKDRLTLNIVDSKIFFTKNHENYDLIYIDGSHDMEDVKEDCESSFKFLNNNGILILDDFLWNGYKDIKKNPISAIMPFLVKNQKNIEIIFMNYQIILKKINYQ